jgi:hypothetical protein
MTQYPIYLYLLIALRTQNAPFLQGGSENEWGFGQILAFLALYGSLVEIGRGATKYLQERNENGTGSNIELSQHGEYTDNYHANESRPSQDEGNVLAESGFMCQI